MRRLSAAFMVLVFSLASGGALAATPERLPLGTFGPMDPLAEARVSHTATSLPDGRVFVIGGWDGEGALASAEVWDPATGSFGPAGSLAEARLSHTATLLPDGRVLVVGGVNGADRDHLLASVEIWSPVTGTFSPAGSLAEARKLHTATLLRDGRVLVAGGWDVAGNAIPSAEVWDPATASFGPTGPLAEARGRHTATLLRDGKVLVAGGWDGSAVASAELWNPVSSRFDPAGSLAAARTWHTATPLDDGRVLVIGGWDTNAQVDPSAEVWDPATASFGLAGSLAAARGFQTATILPDGRVLVVGGRTTDGLLGSAESWDPATASFGPAGSLDMARALHTATLLPDGRVLIIGGQDSEGVTASAETWSLSTPLPSADPVAAVDGFFDALVAKEWDKLSSLSCAANRGGDIVHSIGGTGARTGIVMAFLDAVQIGIADRALILEEISGDTATVSVAGRFSWQVADDALRTFVTRTFEAAGQSPAPSRIDEVMAQEQAVFRALTLAPEVTVVNESGGWLLCSTIFGSPPSPTASLSPAER